MTLTAAKFKKEFDKTGYAPLLEFSLTNCRDTASKKLLGCKGKVTITRTGEYFDIDTTPSTILHKDVILVGLYWKAKEKRVKAHHTLQQVINEIVENAITN